MTTKRPICAWCQRPYGTRKGVVVTFHTIRRKDSEAPPVDTTLQCVLTKRYRIGNLWRIERRWWGGEWRTKYAPFCKLSHALEYAQAAVQKKFWVVTLRLRDGAVGVTSIQMPTKAVAKQMVEMRTGETVTSVESFDEYLARRGVV